MKPINIYALTRLADPERLARLERQMSGRRKKLKIKSWETEGLRRFSEKLCALSDAASGLMFYYSFVMPKLGKEFDLLRVDDAYVVNVELKSGSVPDETIRRQLLQNRYYLATLGRSMYFYTYVSGEDRLVRLSNSGRLVEADWTELWDVLLRQRDCCRGHIEELFIEDNYLISPLTDPGRFLRQEYFLTSQQWDIRRQILEHIEDTPVQGFTGFPGTGKTILLYDIAMQLSRRDKVCLFHLGPHTRELEQLDERLKRIDFYYCEADALPSVQKRYAAIFVDEGHRLSRAVLDDILACASQWHAPVILSYDREDALSVWERQGNGAELIEAIPALRRYRLTNRIRRSSELASYIRHMMWIGDLRQSRRSEYPSVSLAYAAEPAEALRLLQSYQQDGYVYIYGIPLPVSEKSAPTGSVVSISEAVCKEYARVVMLIDSSFAYDEKGYLRLSADTPSPEPRVRELFHGLSRAKERIAIVVLDNLPVFDTLLSIAQR